MRLALALAILLALAPAAVAAPQVEIRRTSHGIPHINARSYEGLGYGYGYASRRTTCARSPRATSR